MIYLILKDFLVQKKTLVFSLIYLIFISYFFQQTKNAMFPTAISVLTYMVVMTSCAYDDKYNSDLLFNSLPINRIKVVGAKYISSYISMIMGTALYSLIVLVINNLEITIKMYPITLEGFIGGFFAVTIIIGIYLPVFFKVGYTKSRFLNLILFFTLFFGASFLIEVIGKTNSQFASRVKDFLMAQSDLIVILGVFIIGILMLITSLIISIKIYTNKEF